MTRRHAALTNLVLGLVGIVFFLIGTVNYRFLYLALACHLIVAIWSITIIYKRRRIR